MSLVLQAPKIDISSTSAMKIKKSKILTHISSDSKVHESPQKDLSHRQQQSIQQNGKMSVKRAKINFPQEQPGINNQVNGLLFAKTPRKRLSSSPPPATTTLDNFSVNGVIHRGSKQFNVPTAKSQTHRKLLSEGDSSHGPLKPVSKVIATQLPISGDSEQRQKHDTHKHFSERDSTEDHDLESLNSIAAGDDNCCGNGGSSTNRQRVYGNQEGRRRYTDPLLTRGAVAFSGTDIGQLPRRKRSRVSSSNDIENSPLEKEQMVVGRGEAVESSVVVVIEKEEPVGGIVKKRHSEATEANALHKMTGATFNRRNNRIRRSMSSGEVSRSGKSNLPIGDTRSSARHRRQIDRYSGGDTSSADSGSAGGSGSAGRSDVGSGSAGGSGSDVESGCMMSAKRRRTSENASVSVRRKLSQHNKDKNSDTCYTDTITIDSSGGGNRKNETRKLGIDRSRESEANFVRRSNTNRTEELKIAKREIQSSDFVNAGHECVVDIADRYEKRFVHGGAGYGNLVSLGRRSAVKDGKDESSGAASHRVKAHG